MRYFSSDLHFSDTRLNLFGRELVANNSQEIDDLIIENWNKKITNNDTVYLLGDVAMNKDGLEKVSLLNGKKILIRGNYDQQFALSELSEYFEEIYDATTIFIGDEEVFLNHYPTNCKQEMFNICGHIHGTWKVQRNMVNVGVDAWHFQPISEEMIAFQMNGIRKHYDQNVFAGELQANNVKTEVDKHKYQLNWVKVNSEWQEYLDEQGCYKWNTNTGEELVVSKINNIYTATISSEKMFQGSKEEIEEKFKIKLER